MQGQERREEKEGERGGRARERGLKRKGECREGRTFAPLALGDRHPWLASCIRCVCPMECDTLHDRVVVCIGLRRLFLLWPNSVYNYPVLILQSDLSLYDVLHYKLCI